MSGHVLVSASADKSLLFILMTFFDATKIRSYSTLKFEKSQYLNSIFQLNYMRYKETLSYKIINFKKMYKFES